MRRFTFFIFLLGFFVGCGTQEETTGQEHADLVRPYEKQKESEVAQAQAAKLRFESLNLEPTEEERQLRQQRIDEAIIGLKAEVEARGGWEVWRSELTAFRLDVKQLFRRAENTLEGIVEGKDGFSFPHGDHIDYLLSEELARNAVGDGPSRAVIAIRNLNEQLSKRGIDLIFVPIPDKTELYPDLLSDATPQSRAVAPHRKALMLDLLESGVETIDLLPAFIDERSKDGLPLYRRDGVQWSTRGIQRAASEITSRIRRYGFVEELSASAISYVLSEQISKTDFAGAMQNIEGTSAALYAAEQIVRQVRLPSGDAYTHVEVSPVLVVGDSFARHYAREQADVGAHIAKELGMPISMYAMMGGGPKVPRLLARKGKEYLEGRRVVIWMFASRYLNPKHRLEWQTAVLP